MFLVRALSSSSLSLSLSLARACVYEYVSPLTLTRFVLR